MMSSAAQLASAATYQFYFKGYAPNPLRSILPFLVSDCAVLRVQGEVTPLTFPSSPHPTFPCRITFPRARFSSLSADQQKSLHLIFYNHDLSITVKLDLKARWKSAAAAGQTEEGFAGGLGALEQVLFPRRGRLHFTDEQLREIADLLFQGMPLDDVKYLWAHWLRLRRKAGKGRAGRASPSSADGAERVGGDGLDVDLYGVLKVESTADQATIHRRSVPRKDVWGECCVCRLCWPGSSVKRT